ncbi:unnamed protein product [Ectocarpus sp. CCAP 1310/34]|nr:unnamed protein product [Ectocarpus sp. CCAP 1310/34]
MLEGTFPIVYRAVTYYTPVEWWHLEGCKRPVGLGALGVGQHIHRTLVFSAVGGVESVSCLLWKGVACYL